MSTTVTGGLPMVREVLLRMQGPAGETPFVFTYREGKKIGDIKTALRGTLRRPR
jgi:hypothetical protein